MLWIWTIQFRTRQDYFFFLSGAWVNNAPAKLLVSLDVFGLDSALAAFVAIAGDVFSFFAILFIGFVILNV